MDSNEMMAFASRVLERALQISGYMPAPLDEPGLIRGPGDLFVDNLARKLIDAVNDADLKAIPLLSALSSSGTARIHARLALALGACSCFGLQATCNECGGSGGSGWKLPYRPEFEVWVRPALTKVADLRLAARNGLLHPLHN